MITRGYYIGEIVDSLTSIAEQVDTRCKLNYTDLNIHLEVFFQEILNLTFNINLHNMNEKRINTPGLDLIDSIKSIGFQITSTKNSKKINQTLIMVSKLTSIPKKINILIIGKKQVNYKLNNALCKRLGFTIEENIWDISSLCKVIVGLSIDILQKIYENIRKEFVKIKMELEIPDENGKFATSIRNYTEKTTKPKINNFDFLIDFLSNQEISEEDTREIINDLRVYIENLTKIPRVTRELYAFMIEKSDRTDRYKNGFYINCHFLENVCAYPNLYKEIRLLETYSIVRSHLDDENPFIEIKKIGNGMLLANMVDFIESKKIDFIKAIGNLDFSEFGN